MKLNLSEDDRLIEERLRRAERELYEAIDVARRSKHPRAREVFRNLSRLVQAINDVGTVAKKDFGNSDSSGNDKQNAPRKRKDK